MILTGTQISTQVQSGRIILDPFTPTQITTNSYDLRLGDKYLRYGDGVLDPRKAAQYDVEEIPAAGLLMRRGDFVLGHSREKLGSRHYVPIIHARSSIARLGLFVHVTADLIDIGSVGNVTFQLFATRDIVLHPDLLIGQVSFWVPEGPIVLYDGKYQGSDGPMPSMVHVDFTAKRSDPGEA